MRSESGRAAIVVAVLAVLVGVAGCTGTEHAAPPTAAAPGAEAETVPGPGAPGEQDLLVAAEEQRIYAVSALRSSGSPAFVAPATAPSIVPTAVLTARALPYDLASLESMGAARRNTAGGWDLLFSLVVERGATLRIVAPGATLRMASGTAGFTSIVAVKGTVELAGEQNRPLSIASWDPVSDRADLAVTDGRSYVRAAGGRLALTDVTATDLGFHSGRTGGVAWTGSQFEPSTGSALRTVVERSRYGMYATRTVGLTVDGGALRDNDLDGLLVHRASIAVTVRRTDVSHNGRNGITVAAGASQVTVSGISAHANATDGIRIDGAPPESGTRFLVERSVLDGNGSAGIVADTATDLAVVENSVTGSRSGIVVTGTATGQVVRGNIVEADEFGIAARDGADTRITDNTVRTATIALQVADARADLHQNVVGSARRYGVSLVGTAGGTTVAENRFGGTGPSAIDTVRATAGATIDIGTNDQSGWTVPDREDGGRFVDYLADHPLLLLWSLILVVPVAAGLWTRHRRRAPDAPDDRKATVPEPRPAHGSDPGDTETTLALPITRVTVVSQASR